MTYVARGSGLGRRKSRKDTVENRPNAQADFYA
jgi:hypothetical protein